MRLGTRHSGLNWKEGSQCLERKELPEKERFPWEAQKASRRAGGCEIGPHGGGTGKGIYVDWSSGDTGD